MLSPAERANAISTLSAPRLRNILTYLANQAESEKSRATIDTLVRLRSFTHEEFPDPEFVNYAERKLGTVTPSFCEQSTSTQSLQHVSYARCGRDSAEPGEIKAELSVVDRVLSYEDLSKSPLNQQGRSAKYANQNQDQNLLSARKRSRSPWNHQQDSPVKVPPQTVFAHDIKRSRCVAVRHLGFRGVWYENYDYIVAIDAEDMLTIFPLRQSDRLTGEVVPRKDAFMRTPIASIYQIHRGGDGCTKIILRSQSLTGDEDNTVLLELWSDRDVADFIALLWDVKGKKATYLGGRQCLDGV